MNENEKILSDYWHESMKRQKFNVLLNEFIVLSLSICMFLVCCFYKPTLFATIKLISIDLVIVFSCISTYVGNSAIKKSVDFAEIYYGQQENLITNEEKNKINKKIDRPVFYVNLIRNVLFIVSLLLFSFLWQH